jgi:16S rRNA (cytidine1402-2'-O)-methyltransferase
MQGTLYLIATPIGNLEDITLRALRTLGEVDLIACEDTRHTRKLMAHYRLAKPLVSYHAHNERERAAELIARLEAGARIALVSDAGTPLVSDPGYSLVRDCIARNIPVVPIPGPSALVTALVASGLPANEFTFVGFLPAKRAARVARLKSLAALDATLIFYEAPHRIRETIADARTMLGNRACVIARELTKLHESFIRGWLAEIEIPASAARGEIVLLVGPPAADATNQQATDAPRSIFEEVEALMRDEQMDQKSALKRVARARQISKSAAYRLLLAERAAREVE